jgi:hypothetical protein
MLPPKATTVVVPIAAPVENVAVTAGQTYLRLVPTAKRLRFENLIPIVV